MLELLVGWLQHELLHIMQLFAISLIGVSRSDFGE